MHKENHLVLERGISATLTKPISSRPVPCILLLHGFASHKDEVGEMYSRLSTALVDENIASLRFDFRGCGASSGNIRDLTVDSQLEDTRIAAAFLRNSVLCDDHRVGLVGFSLGAAIAVIHAANHPAWYRSMVLWSPVGDLEKDFQHSLGSSSFAFAEKAGEVTVDLGWRSVELEKGFFGSLVGHDLMGYAGTYSGAFLVIAGSQDSSARYVGKYVNSAGSGIKKGILVDGADHIFNSLSRDQEVSTRVIDTTVQWLQNHLQI